VFGEAWQDAHGPGTNMGDIALYYQPVAGIGPQFDSLIEFPMKIVMTDVFARGGDARQLERWLQATDAAYGAHGCPIYFLDSHDMSRFADWAVDRSKERLLAAVTFMATLRGPMILFYGTETALAGGTAQPGFTDSGRIPMPWDNLDEDLIARITEVVRLKRELPVLQRGARWPLFADETAVVMARTDEAAAALVGVNLSDEDREITFPNPARGRTWGARLQGPSPDPAGEPGALRWRIPPLTVAVALAGP
jgi:glycosidase